MKISLVIPAYNEEQRLGPFLETVARYHARHPQELREVLVVDDGSIDATVRVAERFAAKIPSLKVLRHGTNRGKGAAVQTGVLAARGEYIVFMDADGATPIGELPKMAQALTRSPIAVGNRWMPGARTDRHSLLRRVAGTVYRRYMGFFGLREIDTMCGFKGYHRSVARTLFSRLQEPRWLFDTEIAFRAVQQGYAVTNFPIRWESKEGSKLSAAALLKTAWHIWPLIRRLKKSAP